MPPLEICIVLRMKQEGRMPYGKHEAHPPHEWWYTSWGGGHQMNSVSHPERNYDETEGSVWRHYCHGN